MATVTIGDFGETEICEKFITKFNYLGKKTRRKKCPAGYKLVGNTCQRVSADEKLSRSRAARRAAKKRMSKRASINRKTKKAMKFRKDRGL